MEYEQWMWNRNNCNLSNVFKNANKNFNKQNTKQLFTGRRNVYTYKITLDWQEKKKHFQHSHVTCEINIL